jgi:hypothetical protein
MKILRAVVEFINRNRDTLYDVFKALVMVWILLILTFKIPQCGSPLTGQVSDSDILREMFRRVGSMSEKVDSINTLCEGALAPARSR